MVIYMYMKCLVGLHVGYIELLNSIGSDSGANSPALVKTFVVVIFHVQTRQSVLLCYVMLYGYLYSASRRRLFRGALSVTGR